MGKASTIFTTKEAKQAGLTKKELKGLIEAGHLKRLQRGVYLKQETENYAQGICEVFEAATLLVGAPSAICLHSALHYYGLDHDIPEKCWIMVPFTKRCAHKSIRVYRSRNPRWDIGINSQDGFQITTLERTLVDALTNPRAIELDQAIAALKVALDKNLTDFHKIIAMAGKLNLVNKISQLIQIMVLLK